MVKPAPPWENSWNKDGNTYHPPNTPPHPHSLLVYFSSLLTGQEHLLVGHSCGIFCDPLSLSHIWFPWEFSGDDKQCTVAGMWDAWLKKKRVKDGGFYRELELAEPCGCCHSRAIWTLMMHAGSSLFPQKSIFTHSFTHSCNSVLMNESLTCTCCEMRRRFISKWQIGMNMILYCLLHSIPRSQVVFTLYRISVR